MPLGGLLSAGASVLGGLFGQGAASGDRAAAQKAYQDTQAAFAAIQAAPDESKPRLLRQYQAAGILTPELEQAIQQGPSEAAAVTTDPELMKAQMQALTSFQQQATGGMTPQARAALNQTRREAETEATGRQQALMQNMQARGLGGSGAELAAALQGGQSAASRASEQSDQLMAQNAAQAQQAALASGQLGGQMQQAQFSQNMAKAQAQDQLNRFNVQAQQAAQAANVGAQNQAQAANLANLQNIGNANVGQANQEQLRQSQARQQQWQNNLALAQAKAGQANQYGNQMNQQANQTAQSWANIGSGAGGLISGAYKNNSNKNDTTVNAYDGGEIKDFRHGGPVPGHAQVPGDSPENDTVKAHLSPGEIVVPRTLAKTELGKTILKLIEHHNELKKNMSEGGEVKQDPSFMDKVANYFAPSPSPYDKLAQQGIRPEDLQRGVRSTGMYLGGEFNAGFANGGSVRGYQAGGQVDSQDYSDYLANSIPPSSEDQKRVDDMAANFRVAQQNPEIYPLGPGFSSKSPIITGNDTNYTTQKQQDALSDKAKAEQEEMNAQDAEDKELDDAAKRHSGNRELNDEAIGAGFEDPINKQAIANRDLEHEMGAADRKAEESTPSEDLGLKPASQQLSPAQPSPESQQEESPVSRLLAATKPQSSFAEQLRQAQEDERNAIQANQLGKAGALIGAGIAKVEPSKEAMGMFDQNIKLAGLPMEQLQQRISMEKFDPQSDYSKTFNTSVAEIMGMDPKKFEGMPASTVADIIPFQAKKMAEENALKKTTLKIEADEQKFSKKMGMEKEKLAETKRGHDIQAENKKAAQAQKDTQRQQDADIAAEKEISSSRSKKAVALAQQNKLFADNALRMVREFPDVDTWTPAQVALFNNEVEKIAKGGTPTDHDAKEMGNPTLVMSMNKLISGVQNTPVGAEQGKFIKLNLKYLQGLKEVSQNVLKQNITDTASAFKRKMGSDGHKRLLARHSGPDELNLYNDQQEAGIRNVMQKAGMSREDAIMELIKRGKLPDIQ